MKLKDALNLHNEDEVTIKKTKEIRRVVDKEVIDNPWSTNKMTRVSVLLDDGNWYDYKEIS